MLSLSVFDVIGFFMTPSCFHSENVCSIIVFLMVYVSLTSVGGCPVSHHHCHRTNDAITSRWRSIVAHFCSAVTFSSMEMDSEELSSTAYFMSVMCELRIETNILE